MNDWCCTTCGKDGHKRKECTSSLSSDSAQSDSSDDESCSVDNDDAQTESVVHESTQSFSQQNQKTMTLNKQPPQDGVKTPKKAGSRKKRKAVRQKDNSEGTQPQISSFFGGQEDISNTTKNSPTEKVKKTSNIQHTPPTPPDIVHVRQNERKKVEVRWI